MLCESRRLGPCLDRMEYVAFLRNSTNLLAGRVTGLKSGLTKLAVPPELSKNGCEIRKDRLYARAVGSYLFCKDGL